MRNKASYLGPVTLTGEKGTDTICARVLLKSRYGSPTLIPVTADELVSIMEARASRGNSTIIDWGKWHSNKKLGSTWHSEAIQTVTPNLDTYEASDEDMAQVRRCIPVNDAAMAMVEDITEPAPVDNNNDIESLVDELLSDQFTTH